MKPSKPGPQADFRQGNYHSVLSHFQLHAPKSARDFVSLIGAHSFLGQIEKALQIWRAHESQLGNLSRIQSRYFLSVTLARTSRFKQARELLKANIDSAKTDGELAYMYLGAGIFNYFRGKFHHASHQSEKSLEFASRSQDFYVEIFATELLGHVRVQLGHRSQGLRLIQEASLLAEAHLNQDVAAAFRNSCLMYEAESGLRPHKMVGELENALNRGNLADAYTRSTLILELSRQLTLRGQFEKAKQLLNQQASSIYSYGNKRHEMTLQLRLAEISYHQGDFYLMGHLLQSARKSISALADRAYELRLIGLELKLPPDIGGHLRERNLERLKSLAAEQSPRIHRQILFRQQLSAQDPLTPMGEDPIHDLLLLAKSDLAQAQAICLDRGYLAIYREISGIAPGFPFLHLLENGLLIGDGSEIFYNQARLSSQQIKLLEALVSGRSGKEALIESVWGFTYDPLRHDALIHNAIAKLRRVLGCRHAWILTTESGWQWDGRVRLMLDTEPIDSGSNRSQETSVAAVPIEDGLNYRQIRALKVIPDESGWSVKHYSQRFKVTTMTAFRDLVHLHQRGLVLRSGRGRACRYLKVN